jgi:hypothetical protein
MQGKVSHSLPPTDAAATVAAAQPVALAAQSIGTIVPEPGGVQGRVHDLFRHVRSLRGEEVQEEEEAVQ